MSIQSKKYFNHKYLYSNDDIFETVKSRINGGNYGATVIVPHVCNNIDLFGAGFAAQVAQHYPSVKQDYHLLGKNFLRNNLGYAQILKVYQEPKFKYQLYFVNMIAQNGIKNHNNPRPINYAGLTKSMVSVAHFITMNTGWLKKTENVEIHCPKFGSGLAGGNWSFISDLIDDIWGQFHVVVYNYNINKNDSSH